MFVYNFKLNAKKTSKIILIIIAIIIICIIAFSVLSIIKSGVNSNGNPNEGSEKNIILDITTNDYTSFLKSVHENIDEYVDKTVNITGYVYRMPDFNDKQFVLSRTMILNSSNSAVVVGILSEYDNASDYKDGDWVKVTGTIIKGNYKGEMPVLKITTIEKCNVPEDEFVYPPFNDKSI